ncbi:MAG: hypothetical protein ABC578_06230 [Candidatus Methanosuratincola petrocarbonis]
MINVTNRDPKLGWGGAGINVDLHSVLVGLANDHKLGHLKAALVNGAAADTPITLTGATADDVFLFALAFAGAGTDVTDVSLITEATLGTDSITFSVDTTGAKVLVLWVDVSARNVG